MPSHFKFKEYCPLVFRNLRERFGLNEATYLVRRQHITRTHPLTLTLTLTHTYTCGLAHRVVRERAVWTGQHRTGHWALATVEGVERASCSCSCSCSL